jgi:HNH endonuclease
METICKTKDCGRKISNKKRGLCRRCYMRWRLTENPDYPRCSLDECDRPISGKHGYCNIHYARYKRFGDPLGIGRGSPGVPRGILSLTGRNITKNGYVRVRLSNNKWMLEHRHIMEEKLGRPLLQGENVHHINGVKTDNNPDNLELWVTLQPKGQRISDLVDYAKEILRRYEN